MKYLLGLNWLAKEFITHSGVSKPAHEAAFSRIQEELDEARASESDAELALELADVIISCAVLARLHGIDITRAVSKKHRINMDRLWIPHPTIPGTVKHIKKVTK